MKIKIKDSLYKVKRYDKSSRSFVLMDDSKEKDFDLVVLTKEEYTRLVHPNKSNKSN